MSFVSKWCIPPETPILEPTEVHLWRASLNQSATRIAKFLSRLTPDEQARASRFHFAKYRNQFIVARGLLKTILSRYLDVAPEQLNFSYNSHGKPYIAEESGEDKLQFSISHSHGIALYAFAYGRELGVDVEYIRPAIACDRIAERFFLRGEANEFRTLTPKRQSEAFFRLWTCKEACLKAKGEGLFLLLDSFETWMPQGKPIAASSTESRSRRPSRCSVLNLRPESGYIGALAVEGNYQLKCWQWSDS